MAQLLSVVSNSRYRSAHTSFVKANVDGWVWGGGCGPVHLPQVFICLSKAVFILHLNRHVSLNQFLFQGLKPNGVRRRFGDDARELWIPRNAVLKTTLTFTMTEPGPKTEGLCFDRISA